MECVNHLNPNLEFKNHVFIYTENYSDLKKNYRFMFTGFYILFILRVYFFLHGYKVKIDCVNMPMIGLNLFLKGIEVSMNMMVNREGSADKIYVTMTIT